MHKHRTVRTHFNFQLTNCFQEWLGLNITHGATDLNQCHIAAFSTGNHAVFDLIGDVRNNLNRTTQIVTATLFTQYVLVNTTGRKVVTLSHLGTNETLVVTEVKVSLCAVFRHKNFTVLERAHCARINVDIRIQLQHGNFQTTGLKNSGQRCGGNAFP